MPTFRCTLQYTLYALSSCGFISASARVPVPPNRFGKGDAPPVAPSAFNVSRMDESQNQAGYPLGAEVVMQAANDVQTAGVHPMTEEFCSSTQSGYVNHCYAFTGVGGTLGPAPTPSPINPGTGGAGAGPGGGGGAGGDSGQFCFSPLAPQQRVGANDVDEHEKGPPDDQDTSAGGIALRGYVPLNNQHQPYPYSGVTIGFGVDLAQNDVSDLQHFGVPARIIDILRPYLSPGPGEYGPRGNAALDFLRTSPISLSLADAQALSGYLLGGVYSALVGTFQVHLQNPSVYNSGEWAFEQLPFGVQTALTDVAYVNGAGFGLSSNASTQLKELRGDVEVGNWTAVEGDLAAMSGGNTSSRYYLDSSLVKIAISLHGVPSDAESKCM